MEHRYRGLVLALSAALMGCANYATLQDAATMPKNKVEFGLAGTFTRYSVEFDSVTTETVDGETTTLRETRDEGFTVPALLMFLRAGVTERLELHGSAWFPFGASVGLKYMAVGDREKGFVFSPGLDVSIPISVSVDGDGFVYMDAVVPMHLGYRFAPGFAGYVTPKYVLRVIGDSLHHAAGSTLGVSIGSGLRLLLEGTLIYDTVAEDSLINGAVGLAF